jgi:broad specificity phosphatase PhoE
MITRIYLIRHGETNYNAEKRIQGSGDSPQLTSLGEKQVLKAKEKLSATTFKKIFSSDLLRARQTASILNKDTHLEIKYLSNLREIYLGPWENVLWSEIELQYPSDHNAFYNIPDKFFLEGAETIRSLQERGVRTIEYILKQSIGDDVLVVSHGGLIQSVLTFYAGRPLNQIWDENEKIVNCSCSILEFQNDEFVKFIND